MVRVAAAQALAKVAVRSGEPYRIQAYSLLAAAAGCGGGPAAAAGGGGLAADRGGPDPLGLAPVVGPALEVLDAMYAGEGAGRGGWGAVPAGRGPGGGGGAGRAMTRVVCARGQPPS